MLHFLIYYSILVFSLGQSLLLLNNVQNQEVPKRRKYMRMDFSVSLIIIM